MGLPAHFLRHSRRKEPLPSSAGGGLIWLASGNPRPRAGGCSEQQEGHTKAAGLGELPSGSGSRHSLAAASPSRFQSLEGSPNLIQCLRTMWAVGGTQGQALLPEAFLGGSPWTHLRKGCVSGCRGCSEWAVMCPSGLGPGPLLSMGQEVGISRSGGPTSSMA